jgi:hypothetical protein
MRKGSDMDRRRIKEAAGGLALAGVLAGGTVALTTPSVASTKATKPVSGYVFAWRQVAAKKLLVAYRARNNTSSAQSAHCSLRVKPKVKYSKPDYYSFPEQKFSLPKPSSKYTYIGIFTLPKRPKTFDVTHAWVSCS